jgi:hypothetical protein
MSPWIVLAIGVNTVLVLIFASLAIRSRPGAIAIALGLVHLLLAAAFSVAPWRSIFDPGYFGFGLGLFQFERRAATLPTAILFSWAACSAFILGSGRRDRALWLVASGDLLFALNQLASLFLQPSAANVIQFGEYLTISGMQSLAIMAAFFVVGPAWSAWWTARRARRSVA